MQHYTNNVTTGRRLLTSALALLLLLVAGMATATAETAAPTIDDAKAIALTHAGFVEADVFFTKLGTDRDDGRTEFEINFIAGDTEYEYEIDTADGTICKTSTNTVKGKMKDIDPSVYIGFDRALEIALTDAGYATEEVTLLEIQFDFDDGRAEYEIEFTMGDTEYQVDLDAATGEIVKRETEKH